MLARHWLCLLFVSLALPTFADDPTPVPVPIPVPAPVPSACITDPNGNPILPTAQLGDLIVLSGKQAVHGTDPKSLLWIVEPLDRSSRVFILDNGLTAVLPTGSTPVKVVATQIVAMSPIQVVPAKGDRPPMFFFEKGDSPSFATVIIQCGDPTPPPVPPGPGPVPPGPVPPVPPVPAVKHLALVLVDDLLHRQPYVTKIMMNQVYINSLFAKNIPISVIDRGSNTMLGQKYVKEAGSSPIPTLLIRDNDADKLLVAVPFPQTIADLDSAYTKYLAP